MNIKVKIILVSIFFSVINILITNLIEYYIPVYLNDWIFWIFKKYLIFNFDFVDGILLRFFPILTAIFLLIQKKIDIKIYFYQWISIICMFTLSIIIAEYTWFYGEKSNFLPDNILDKPFRLYFSLFILAGILLPFSGKLFKKKELKNTLD